MGKVGRPRITDDCELISLDVCIERVQEYLNLPTPPFTRRTLRNKITKGEFQRYGSYHIPMVDWNEVKRSLHWKRRAS